MSEPIFKSSLSVEEIENNFKEIDFFSGIMDSLQEILACSRGKPDAETFEKKQSLPTINVVEIRDSPAQKLCV